MFKNRFNNTLSVSVTQNNSLNYIFAYAFVFVEQTGQIVQPSLHTSSDHQCTCFCLLGCCFQITNW